MGSFKFNSFLNHAIRNFNTASQFAFNVLMALQKKMKHIRI